MKSPNVYTTSFTRASSQTERSTLNRTFYAFALATLACSLVCSACRSASSEFSSRDAKKNPYAQYEPKTPEEKAYYQDVYSGDWHEDSMGEGASICKQSASTHMPEHWAMLPPGAKTMDQIRAESSQRKYADAASQRSRSFVSAPTQGAYAAQSSVPVQTSTNVSASSQPVATPSAYASQAPATPSAYASQAPATPSAYASQAPATPSAYASQAPATSNAYAPQATATPSSYAPQTSVPANASYQGASVDLFESKNWIVRGQAPEDDPFADETDEEEDVKAEKNVEVENNEAKVKPAKPEPVKTPVEMKEENVNAKSVAANAAVARAGRPGAVQVQPVVVDPSIAAPFADVKRPVNRTPESSNPNAKRADQDEYVVSGGDSKGGFYSREDWSYENLDSEDSVAHFDTVDGRILVEPSNKLFIYSPRFGAVRQTLGPIEGDHRLALETAVSTDEPTENESAASVDVRSQEVKPLGANAIQNVEGAEASLAPSISTGAVGALEADAQIRLGALLTSETVDDLSSEDSSLMFDGAVAAQGWSGEQGVAVSTELVNAFSNAYVEGAATIFSIKDDTKTSKLRVIKIANKDAAKPGEFVEFTLRFENIGDETIGNVTILDNLSSRLRYVDGTAKSSVQADFSANLSETGSLVLRWEITEPLEPKQFGVVRFICKVQ